MEKSYYKNYFRLEKNNWLFRVRRNLIYSIFEEYNVGRGVKILDYGCGSGFIVGQLQARGYDAYGTDISREAIEYGASQGIKNLYSTNEIKVDFPDESFDLILAMDVVEHIKEDELVIKELERLLKPNGRLIITVPAYQWMWGVQDEVSHHFRRYTMRSIIKLVSNSSNLLVLRKTYFNTFLFPAVALVRLVSKWFNLRHRESDFDLSDNFLNPVLYFIFNTEIKILKWINYPFGISILLTLEKNASNTKK
ncbi:MAG: class I SAM-dependent methyltransferase [bacterium]|nr:class I SAM-dependent methyltransferase [bacterium]